MVCYPSFTGWKTRVAKPKRRAVIDRFKVRRSMVTDIHAEPTRISIACPGFGPVSRSIVDTGSVLRQGGYTVWKLALASGSSHPQCRSKSRGVCDGYLVGNGVGHARRKDRRAPNRHQ